MGYVSDNLLSNASTYDNQTFASLGVTPGTFKWAWASGANQNLFGATKTQKHEDPPRGRAGVPGSAGERIGRQQPRSSPEN